MQICIVIKAYLITVIVITMVVISTFVIFDIETTGLPRYERNQTKITELTFLAVDRRDIERTSIGQAPVTNKLSYLFNPQRNIQPEVCALTGLTNAVLVNQPIFKNRIRSLNSFLEDLPKPVCLVAHNGSSFDFKILRSEYIDAGANLPNDLLCVDSLWGFRKILKENNVTHETLLSINSSKSDDDLLTDEEDWPELNTSTEEWDEIDKLVESFSHISPNKDKNTPITILDKESNSTTIKARKSEAISHLFEKKTKSDKVLVPCKLQDLYKRLLNKEAVNAHRSEADCLMLLECIVALKEQFLNYADSVCKSVNEVKPIERY